MNTVWNQEQIKKLLRDFYKISHIRVGIFTLNGDELNGYPMDISDYCSAIKKKSVGSAVCKECDFKAYQHVSSSKKSHIYACKAGLTEMVIPIQNNGKMIGYLMMGQFRCAETQTIPSNHIKAYWNNLGLNIEDMLQLYNRIPLIDKSLIYAYEHILQACAAYVWMEDYIKNLEEPLNKKVENYIRNHLEEKITLTDLINTFHVGKTTLCNTVKSKSGITVSGLIRRIRIEEAKNLLLTDSLAISEIAHRVGIDDYNYFTKVFKKETGLTPSEYRKLW